MRILLRQKYLIPTICLFLGLIVPWTSSKAGEKITAKVVVVKGEVLYNGEAVEKDQVLAEDGLIEVKAKSYLKLLVNEYNSSISISANSKLKLAYSKKKKTKSPYIFVDGLLRWVTKGKAKKKGFMRTKQAAIGVRGTDFLVVSSALLGETEIYCFEGEVVFANRKNTKDRGLVKVNDWGGVGGRFGTTVGDIVPMTEKQIDHVKGLLE